MKNTTSAISVEKVGPAEYKVTSSNGVHMGEFVCKEDGFFDFWPELRPGYWPSYMLRALADALDEINEPWEKILNLELVEHEPNSSVRSENKLSLVPGFPYTTGS